MRVVPESPLTPRGTRRVRNPRNDFFSEIKNVYKELYNMNITNERIQAMENAEATIRQLLGRNLSTEELEWLGVPVTPRARPRVISSNNVRRIMEKYGAPSPERPRRRTTDVVFLDKTFHPTTEAKVSNKVFLISELVNDKVKYVYERESLNKLNLAPFTKRVVKPEHIKSYANRNVVTAKVKNLRNKSWNAEFFDKKVLSDFGLGKIKKHHYQFLKLFPTRRSLTKYMGLPNTWALQNMKSLGQFTASDVARMRLLKRAIDRETDVELKNLYENRLVLVVSNEYGYRPRNFLPMLRRFINKVPSNMLNVVKV